jgi:hypothetical protein
VHDVVIAAVSKQFTVARRVTWSAQRNLLTHDHSFAAGTALAVVRGGLRSMTAAWPDRFARSPTHRNDVRLVATFPRRLDQRTQGASVRPTAADDVPVGGCVAGFDKAVAIDARVSANRESHRGRLAR